MRERRGLKEAYLEQQRKACHGGTAARATHGSAKPRLAWRRRAWTPHGNPTAAPRQHHSGTTAAP
jgi:hypothetical protein